MHIQRLAGYGVVETSLHPDKCGLFGVVDREQKREKPESSGLRCNPADSNALVQSSDTGDIPRNASTLIERPLGQYDSKQGRLSHSRSSRLQDLSGLKRIIWWASAAVLLPRSFPYTTPS